MAELVSVKGDENTHSDGQLHASTNPNKFWIEGKLLVTIDSTADVDGALHNVPDVNSATGSEKFSCLNKKVHRHNDERYCSASTVVSGQTKFTSG